MKIVNPMAYLWIGLFILHAVGLVVNLRSGQTVLPILNILFMGLSCMYICKHSSLNPDNKEKDK